MHENMQCPTCLLDLVLCIVIFNIYSCSLCPCVLVPSLAAERELLRDMDGNKESIVDAVQISLLSREVRPLHPDPFKVLVYLSYVCLRAFV